MGVMLFNLFGHMGKWEKFICPFMFIILMENQGGHKKMFSNIKNIFLSTHLISLHNLTTETELRLKEPFSREVKKAQKSKRLSLLEN